MSLTPEFPAPVRFGGRLRFDQHEHENYKRSLAGFPPSSVAMPSRSVSLMPRLFAPTLQSTGARWAGASAVASANRRRRLA